MALSQSVASELLEVFRAGGALDLIWESIRLVLEASPSADRRRGAGCGRRAPADPFSAENILGGDSANLTPC